MRSCVHLVCQVWQCATSECLSGEESMRMKPTLVMPSWLGFGLGLGMGLGFGLGLGLGLGCEGQLGVG